MIFISRLLTAHLERYPRMQLDDVYKLLHQAAMGPEHAIRDVHAAREWLVSEIAGLEDGPPEPTIDPISPDGQLARIHLRPYVRAGRSIDELLEAFVQTAQSHPLAPESLAKFCGCLGDLAGTGKLPFSREEVERYFATIAAQGYPVAHHSQTFRAHYRPAYRVVHVEHLTIADGGNRKE